MNLENFENVKILIVESNELEALALKKSLEEHKLEVTVANSYDEAINTIHKSPPQVVITNIDMSKMNGYDLCKELKSRPETREIPIIFLTALKDPMDVIKGIECGADSFLTKPCDISFLLSTMKDLIVNKTIRKEQLQGGQMAFFFNGTLHLLQINRVQITDLLLSTYLNAIQKNSELEKACRKLNLLYDEIKQKNNDLMKLNEVKNQFLGMAAHDLKNPLGVIVSCSQLLQMKYGNQIDEKGLNILKSIEKASSYMLNLINDLLDITIIESGRGSMHFSEVDLHEVINECLNLLKTTIEKKQIKIIFSSNVKNEKIVCDATKIAQVIINLLSNAIKFSYSGGAIEITLNYSNNEMKIIVKDYGIGIPFEAQKELFKPFNKKIMEGTAGEKGSGLGLSIVHKIVKDHKGNIWFESQEGKGSTFIVTLPNEKESVL